MRSVVSLFSGCGGLDLGFKQAGFDLTYACDNDATAIDVYRSNLDLNAYVRDVTSNAFHQDIADIGRCDVVLGGFPCQGFSKAGPKQEFDSRNLLYLEMKRAVETLRPKVFLAENVDGLSQNFKGKYIERISNDFESIGYQIEFMILNAVHYGVAQHRRRIFFVGSQKPYSNESFNWPQHTHSSETRNGESHLETGSDLFSSMGITDHQPARTIRDAIGDLIQLSENIPDHLITNDWNLNGKKIISHIGEGQKLCNVRFADTSVYTWQIPEVFGDVDEIDVIILETIGKNRRHKKYGNIPNGNPLPENIIKELSGLKGIKRRVNRLVKLGYLKVMREGYDLKGAMFCSGLYKRPKWDEPSPTVLTNYHNPRYFIHPERNTTFSLRECARLQGFPDSFNFSTNSNDKKQLINAYRLVGNAVPPPLAFAMASSIKNHINNIEGATIETTPVGNVIRSSAA